MSEAKGKFKITVIIDGEVTDMFYSNGTTEILFDAFSQGVDLPSSCEVGYCEACSCEVDGDVVSLMESMVEGRILTCNSYAQSDLILRYKTYSRN